MTAPGDLYRCGTAGSWPWSRCRRATSSRRSTPPSTTTSRRRGTPSHASCSAATNAARPTSAAAISRPTGGSSRSAARPATSSPSSWASTRWCTGSSSAGRRARSPRTRGLDVFCGTLEEYETDQQYDVVFMSHVIEHVLDPVETVATIERLLAPGGVLYLETPERRLARRPPVEAALGPDPLPPPPLPLRPRHDRPPARDGRAQHRRRALGAEQLRMGALGAVGVASARDRPFTIAAIAVLPRPADAVPPPQPPRRRPSAAPRSCRRSAGRRTRERHRRHRTRRARSAGRAAARAPAPGALGAQRGPARRSPTRCSSSGSGSGGSTSRSGRTSRSRCSRA